MPSAKSPRRPALSGGAKSLAYVGLSLGVAVAMLFLRSTGLFERLELPLVDLRTKAVAGRRPPDPRIVLAEVRDEDTAAVQKGLAQPWPWPLDFNKGVLTLLGKAGARVVVVDVFHLDRGAGPDDAPTSADRSERDLQAMGGEAESAKEYGEALAAHGRVALAFRLAHASEYEVPVRLAAATPKIVAPGLLAPPGAIEAPFADLPVSRVAAGAAVLGFANVDPDLDGVVRRAHVVGRWGERTARSLALAAAELATGKPARLEPGAVVVGADARPLMEDGSFLVDFRGAPARTYPRVAPWQLIQWNNELEASPAGTVPAAAKAALEGKIVIWGVNLAGAADQISAPTSAMLDGPEFQAAVIDDLLNGGGRVRASPTENRLVLLLAAALVGLVAGTLRGRAASAGAALLAMLAVLSWAWVRFLAGTSVDVATPVLGVVLTWGTTTAARLLTEGRYNRWLEGAFGRYLAPSLIDALKKDPSLLELGGRRRELTILFSDVKGFTGLSEQLTSQQLVHLLNEYLTSHCEAVFAQGGVVDKFIGDAVMAFFNDPVPAPDHAVRACRTALDVQARLPGLAPLLASLGVPEFVVRIGLNSGEATVGNMGSHHRFDYTCMGDTVNLASRLEGANKFFGTRILVGPLTYEGAKDAILAKSLGRVGVKGRAEPVPVHELVAMREGAPPSLVAHVLAFARAQDAARRGDLPAAREALADALREKPADGACRWFGGVLDAMESGEEPTPWSGVVVLTEK